MCLVHVFGFLEAASRDGRLCAGHRISTTDLRMSEQMIVAKDETSAPFTAYFVPDDTIYTTTSRERTENAYARIEQYAADEIRWENDMVTI